MTRLIIIILLSVALGYYLSFLWMIWQGLRPVKRTFNSSAPLVSVVIAARNEEANIQNCLQSLLQQTYDPRGFEVIVVDDHSQDQTLTLAKAFATGQDGPKITVLSCYDSSGQEGKPTAITLGIESSQGEIILCTDADCVVPNEWITSMVRSFEPCVAFVAGPVAEQATGTFISQIQSLEFLGLITAGAGLIGSGHPVICNGANIAYRKSTFREVNGFGRSGGSCDDETLMQRIVKRNMGNVVFNFDVNAIVTTSTPQTILGFWNQRTRWAAKRDHYEDKSILARLIALYGFFLIVFLSAFAALLDPIIYISLSVVLAVKLAAELTVLTSGARMFRQRVPIGYFLIAELFHVPYIVFAALIGQFGELRWKNRKLAQ